MRERALQLYNSISRIAVNSAIPESVKSDIRQLYRIVVGEPLKHCNCPDLYSDAWLVIKLKFKKIMDTKYKLKRGVVIQTADLEGTYTRANITDDVAREYLAKFPNKRNLFEEIPEEVATEEETPDEVATEKKPKRKKSK